MIISDTFIWLHFPKCSGTETERLIKSRFGDDPSVKFDPIDPTNVIWHHSIDKRRAYDPSFDVGGRAVISNIRRLPSWLLSRVYFEYERSPQHKVTREMLRAGRFFESNGHESSADQYAIHYSKPPVTHWIRTERLAEDFTRVFSRFGDLTIEAVRENMRVTNQTKIKYVKEIGFYFTQGELNALYDANPVWKAVELQVYGDIYRVA